MQYYKFAFILRVQTKHIFKQNLFLANFYIMQNNKLYMNFRPLTEMLYIFTAC